MKREPVLIIVFAVIVLASGADLAADLAHDVSPGHVVKEALVMVFSTIAVGLLLLDLRRRKEEIVSLRQQLENARSAPVSEYVTEARGRLATAVARQFSEWQLTTSEREVGWLLLKGLSLKEISLLRETREKTVRQQASAIYKKSGISGRHAFSAWFIEDIL